MGFFSWHRCDDHKVITNRYSHDGALPVEMLDNDGHVWAEDQYEGYGVFGGMDYYDLVDLMNGGTGDRDRGIRLDLDNQGDPKILRPRFRAPGCSKCWDELPDPDMAENQGYFY